MQVNMLTPMQIQKGGPVLFVDYINKKVLDANGTDHTLSAKGLFDELDKFGQDADDVPNVDKIYGQAIDLQQKVFEENEELIDGAQRIRHKDFHPWSGGETTGEQEIVDPGEDDQLHQEVGVQP